MKIFLYSLVRKFVTLFYKTIPELLGLPVPPRPTASIIITNGKKIAVVKVSYKNGYSLPGGGVRKGESYEDAAKRETLEETGLKITTLRYFRSLSSNNEYPAVNIVYIGRGKGKLKSSIEGQPMWIEPEKIYEKIVFSDGREAVKEYIKLKS